LWINYTSKLSLSLYLSLSLSLFSLLSFLSLTSLLSVKSLSLYYLYFPPSYLILISSLDSWNPRHTHPSSAGIQQTQPASSSKTVMSFQRQSCRLSLDTQTTRLLSANSTNMAFQRQRIPSLALIIHLLLRPLRLPYRLMVWNLG
jgi:hypothetical protein